MQNLQANYKIIILEKCKGKYDGLTNKYEYIPNMIQ